MPKKKEPEPLNATIVAVQFRFEHRDSQGRLITCSKNLKNRTSLKEWLKRLFRFA